MQISAGVLFIFSKSDRDIIIKYTIHLKPPPVSWKGKKKKGLKKFKPTLDRRTRKQM